MAFSSCVCWDYSEDDESVFDDEDVDCDCGGLGEALYRECSGAILLNGIEVDEDVFVQSCYDAMDNDTSETDAYYCYINSFCGADDCEEFAKRLELCAIMP